MPHSCAIAGRCRPALVEPPEAATTVAAFSSALRVTMSRGRMLARDQIHDLLARRRAETVADLVGRRRAGRIRQRQPDRLGDRRHRVGGELRAAGAGRRAGDLLQLVEVGVRHAADGTHADRLEEVLHGDLAAAERARQDRAAIDEDRRHVEPAHRHHHAGQRLVAAGEPDQRVVAMAAHGELDGIGDHLARHERRLHALVAHGDAVGHRDGGELARRAAGRGDALLGGLRLAGERDVAGRRLVPAGGDADEGLMDLLARQPHRVVVGAVRRAARPFRHVTAWQTPFVERPRIHTQRLPAAPPHWLDGAGRSGIVHVAGAAPDGA